MLDTENSCTETYLKDLNCEYTLQVVLNTVLNVRRINN